MDISGLLMVLALYGVYRAGRFVERTEIERQRAEAMATQLADTLDRDRRI